MACSDFAARAKQRVSIMRPVETVDAYGGTTRTWEKVNDCWARLEPLSGREVFSQQAIQSRVSHRATIRWQNGLKDVTATSDYRFVHEGRQYTVLTMRNLASDMKSYGSDFQEFLLEENGPYAAS